jgi:L-threonylcarbamoyladenylate synthase
MNVAGVYKPANPNSSADLVAGRARHKTIVESDVDRGAALLRGGGLVAFPTETVYGLGASCFDQRAVARLFEAKERPRFDPLIVHLAEPSDVTRVARPLSDLAARLARRFWPGPLTLVLPKLEVVPDLVTAGLPTVAVRVPDHAMARELIRAAGVPVVAPSANRFGRVSPTTAPHVLEQLDGQIDMVLDGGPCRIGIESTVVQVSDGLVRLLRPGGTTLEQLEEEVGPVELSAPTNSAGHQGLPAPGMLPAHYAPRTRLLLLDSQAVGNQAATAERLAARLSDASISRHRVGLLSLRPVAGMERCAAREVLSVSGDMRAAAAGFFAALRRLDAAGLDLIVAVPFPEAGLGRALNDRLRRAAQAASSAGN